MVVVNLLSFLGVPIKTDTIPYKLQEFPRKRMPLQKEFYFTLKFNFDGIFSKRMWTFLVRYGATSFNGLIQYVS